MKRLDRNSRVDNKIAAFLYKIKKITYHITRSVILLDFKKYSLRSYFERNMWSYSLKKQITQYFGLDGIFQNVFLNTCISNGVLYLNYVVGCNYFKVRQFNILHS